MILQRHGCRLHYPLTQSNNQMSLTNEDTSSALTKLIDTTQVKLEQVLTMAQTPAIIRYIVLTRMLNEAQAKIDESTPFIDNYTEYVTKALLAQKVEEEEMAQRAIAMRFTSERDIWPHEAIRKSIIDAEDKRSS